MSLATMYCRKSISPRREDLDRLQQGVDAWNAWRAQNCEHRVNLSGANLRRADLRGANLTGADLGWAIPIVNGPGVALEEHLLKTDLSGANLEKTNLTGADLRMADLSGADLCHAVLIEANLKDAQLSWAKLYKTDLSGADLRNTSLGFANLTGADLSGANIRDTILIGANLMGANLTGADLVGAHIAHTIFGNTNLSTTKGLDLCIQIGPSVLDHSTLQRSRHLPLAFLRGCGLPDRLIDYLPSLLEEAIQYYSCFISYSSKDAAFADRLYADLQNKGVRCWFAPEDMKIGDPFRQKIDEAIHVHERLLLILSENSVSSEWVEKEVETAFEKEKRRKRTVLFPVRLDDAVMDCYAGWSADIRRTRHIGDFRLWKNHDVYQQAFERVLRDLTAIPDSPAPDII